MKKILLLLLIILTCNLVFSQETVSIERLLESDREKEQIKKEYATLQEHLTAVTKQLNDATKQITSLQQQLDKQQQDSLLIVNLSNETTSLQKSNDLTQKSLLAFLAGLKALNNPYSRELRDTVVENLKQIKNEQLQEQAQSMIDLMNGYVGRHIRLKDFVENFGPNLKSKCPDCPVKKIDDPYDIQKRREATDQLFLDFKNGEYFINYPYLLKKYIEIFNVVYANMGGDLNNIHTMIQEIFNQK